MPVGERYGSRMRIFGAAGIAAALGLRTLDAKKRDSRRRGKCGAESRDEAGGPPCGEYKKSHTYWDEGKKEMVSEACYVP